MGSKGPIGKRTDQWSSLVPTAEQKLELQFKSGICTSEFMGQEAASPSRGLKSLDGLPIEAVRSKVELQASYKAARCCDFCLTIVRAAEVTSAGGDGEGQPVSKALEGPRRELP